MPSAAAIINKKELTSKRKAIVIMTESPCDHLIATITSDLGIFQKCLKCGESHQIYKDHINEKPNRVTEKGWVINDHPQPEKKEPT